MVEIAKPKYIALTIGPIFATLNLSASPAALWTGSYMFSFLTKTICEKLVENGVPAKNIVSPYYPGEDESKDLLECNKGVGLFHDRVIIRIDDPNKSINIEKIKEDSIKKVAEQFSVDPEYLKEYVRIASVEFEAQNAITGCGRILDCLELATPFVSQDKNELFALFRNGGSEQANEAIKNIPIVESIRDNWQLLRSNSKSIKSLENIAAGGVETVKLKKNTYYAIVRSDGDKMSDVFSNLKSDEEIRTYSKTCLEYCSEIAKLTSEYGGVTIYSGGDDLLALMPLERHIDSKCECKNLFEFIKKANELMTSKFKGMVDALNESLNRDSNPQDNDKQDGKINCPTLSFGVCVTYMRHPLYEALKLSEKLLFGVAKKQRNCTALCVQKHSGQSEGIIISNSAIDKLIELKNTIDNGINNVDGMDKVFLSAIYKLTTFEPFFKELEEGYINAQDDKISQNDTTVQNLFNNIFDADEHKENKFLKKKLPEFFCGMAKQDKEYDIRLMPEYLKEYLRDHGIKVESDNDSNMTNPYPTVTLCYLLRILKLYYEKAGEQA